MWRPSRSSATSNSAISIVSIVSEGYFSTLYKDVGRIRRNNHDTCSNKFSTSVLFGIYVVVRPFPMFFYFYEIYFFAPLHESTTFPDEVQGLSTEHQGSLHVNCSRGNVTKKRPRFAFEKT